MTGLKEFTKREELLETEEIVERIARAKAALGDEILILGHHYQRDEVFRFADFSGDSFKLARDAAEQRGAKYIVFCGVHFMAESADILTADDQVVILPDIKAGCSMADMANLDQVLDCWEDLEERVGGTIIPVTYMNSTAAIKAFCGDHGGIVCTSSNAKTVYEWAFDRGERILFLPDEHLGRNTGHQTGISDEEMCLWDPKEEGGNCTTEDLVRSKVILWRGFCSVHMTFKPQHVDMMRERYPGVVVIAHPECTSAVVAKSDFVGSTELIIKQVKASPPGTVFAVGTEHHLVNRLNEQLPDHTILPLSPFACNCATMWRIDPVNVMEVLEGLVEGRVINQVSVPKQVADSALVALNRMLENA